jgi:hypothetical protein
MPHRKDRIHHNLIQGEQLTKDVVNAAGERGVGDERLGQFSEVEFQETGHCVGVLLRQVHHFTCSQ